MTYNHKQIQSIMKLLAAHLGKDCEIVLHDFSQGMEHSVSVIENPNVTNRCPGSGISSFGAKILESCQGDMGEGVYNRCITTEDGKVIRTSFAVLRDEMGEMAGILCINQDISQLMMVQRVLQEQMGVQLSNVYMRQGINDVSRLLGISLLESIQQIGKPVAEMTKADKCRAIAFLEERGIFSITKSADRVCEAFGITKYFLYSQLGELRKEAPEGEAAGG